MGRSVALYKFSESEGPVLHLSDGGLEDEEKDQLESILFVKDSETTDSIEVGERKADYHLITGQTPWMKGGGEEYYLLAVLYDENEMNNRIGEELDIEDLDENFVEVLKNNWKGLYQDEERVLENQDADCEEVEKQAEEIEGGFQDFVSLYGSQWARMNDIVAEQQRELESSGEVAATEGYVASRKEILIFTAIFSPLFATAFTSFWGTVKRIWGYKMSSQTFEILGLDVAAYEIQLVALFMAMGVFSLVSIKARKRRFKIGLVAFFTLIAVTVASVYYENLLWLYGVLTGASLALILTPLGFDFAKNTVPDQRLKVTLIMTGTAFVLGLIAELLTFGNPNNALIFYTVFYILGLGSFIYYHRKKHAFEREKRSFIVHKISKKNLWLLLGSFFIFMVSSSLMPWEMNNPVSVGLYRMIELLGLAVLVALFHEREDISLKMVYIVSILSIGVSVMFFGIGTLEIVKNIGLAINAVAWGPLLGIITYVLWIDSSKPEKSVKWIGIAQALFYFGGVIGVLTGRYFFLFIPPTTVGFIAALLTYVATFPAFRTKDTFRMKIGD